jgi:cytochrome P450
MNTPNVSVKNAKPAPGPGGYPLVGVLPLVWNNPLQFFLNAAKGYGDVVRLEFGLRTFYLVTGPESIRYVLQDNNRNYGKGYDQAKPLLGEGLVTSEGKFWLRQRRLMSPVFHRSEIDTYTSFMTQATEEMLERWDQVAARGEPLDIADEMMRLTQTIILRTMFSTDIGDQAAQIGEAFDITLHFLNQTLFSPVDWFRHLPTPANLRNQRALRFLDNFVYQLINERRQSGEDKGDLLSQLLLARDEETGAVMDDKQIRDEVMTIFLAGHETTANALAWTWYLLSNNPKVESRLLEEIDAQLSGQPPQVEDLSKLELTDRVFQEALRLYPPAWMFARTAIEDDEVGGYHIPAGERLMISPYVTHRLPYLWDRPEAFDPDRFLPERSQERPRFAYFPFGGGPRLCIGNHFATVEAKLVIARVLQRYRLELVPGYQVEAKPIATLQPKPGVLMNIKKRK